MKILVNYVFITGFRVFTPDKNTPILTLFSFGLHGNKYRYSHITDFWPFIGLNG